MYIYTIHFFTAGDIKSRASKIADSSKIVALSPNSLLVASELSEREISEKLAEPIFVFNQFSNGWRGPSRLDEKTSDKIVDILNSGRSTVSGFPM